MGASLSSERRTSAEQEEQEALAASTGSLKFLQSAFANLCEPQSHFFPLSLLSQSLSLPPLTLAPPFHPSARKFPVLLSQLGPSTTDLFFTAGKDGVDWIAFLRGFNCCCARMPLSSSLNLVYKVFLDARQRAGIVCRLESGSDDDDGGKVKGSLEGSDLLMFLWMCWTMEQSSRLSISETSKGLILPDLSHMLMSALISSHEIGNGENVWKIDEWSVGKSVAFQKLNEWILATAPGLASCFPQFLREKIRAIAISGVNLNNSNQSGGSGFSLETNYSSLLTCGRAWAISLTQRSTIGEALSAASVPGALNHKLDTLLYRSSTHGKGLSRFWSNVEGYNGPLLFLFSGNSATSTDFKSSDQNWVVGVLSEHGYQNKDGFYGSSAHLYAISPIFRWLSPTGKEKNFIYSHLHPTGRFYEASPKPIGLAFGGVSGNERIFIEEDFSKVIIRHHVVDKTYQHGSLTPNQGYLPVEASLVDAEVWGFGGSSVKEQQNVFKRREELFTEQRRKVDLKISNWEDSPEKMMMGMISDPNRVQREDR